MCLGFDAVVGHHPRTVRPITAEYCGGCNRLIACSLGDFCYRNNTLAYRYGMVVKLTLGQSPDGELFLGDVEWRFLECCKRAGKDLRVAVTNRVSKPVT